MSHSQVLKSLLLPIGVADALAALFWIRTQIWHLAKMSDYDGECAVWAVSGFLSFGWMSMWTCLLAHYLHEALVRARPPSFRSTFTKCVAWGCPPLLTVATLSTHRYNKCVPTTPGREARVASSCGVRLCRCGNAAEPWYVVLPVLAMSYCCVQVCIEV